MFKLLLPSPTFALPEPIEPYTLLFFGPGKRIGLWAEREAFA